MPRQETEHYQGFEREQAFVRKWDDRLFAYCRQRHSEHWRGKKRTIPTGVRHEGEEGWWFPVAWVTAFSDRFGEQVRSNRPRPDLAKRIAQVERAVSSFAGQRPGRPELESWGLPVGTQFCADETVRYPDGTWETMDEIRLRKGRWSPRSPTWAAQENLEALLKLTKQHLEPDGSVSDAVAKSKLASSAWDAAA